MEEKQRGRGVRKSGWAPERWEPKSSALTTSGQQAQEEVHLVKRQDRQRGRPGLAEKERKCLSLTAPPADRICSSFILGTARAPEMQEDASPLAAQLTLLPRPCGWVLIPPASGWEPFPPFLPASLPSFLMEASSSEHTHQRPLCPPLHQAPGPCPSALPLQAHHLLTSDGFSGRITTVFPSC